MSQTPLVSFYAYKATFLRAIRKVLDETSSDSLNEAAFPAYAHPNFLINWLFWQRLFVVMKNVANGAPYENTLDFGCGSGVLLPFLAHHSQNVIGVDRDLEPYKLITTYFNFPPNIQVIDNSTDTLQKFPAASFDLITALDVLEHVDDLSSTLEQLLRLLKPDGWIIVSGPTENFFYRIGRKLAGKEFSGVYHERDIAEIKTIASNKGYIKNLKVLYHPIPLFEIFNITKK